MQDYLDFVHDTLQDIANYKEQIQDLQQKIIDRCPFQVGEIVMFREKQAYISKVQLGGYPEDINFELYEVNNNKKGRKMLTYYAKLSELTKISEHNN